MSVSRFGVLSGALALALFALPGIAMAAITADLDGDPFFKQTQDDPCVIGDPSCNQAGFLYTNRSGPAVSETYTLYSPVYDAVPGNTVAAPSDIPVTFSLGWDMNIATGQGNEQLIFFKTFIVTGCAEGTLPIGAGDTNTFVGTTCVLTLDAANSFTPASPITIPDNHNGVGFTDIILNGFSLNPNNLYVFQASWQNDNDGMEELFLIRANAPPVAEPATLLLLGTGLVGLAAWGRKRIVR